MTLTKSTSRWQGRFREKGSEGSLSANLRADGQKSHIRPNPWVREHDISKPIRRTWGMVNVAVVQGKIMLLPGEISWKRDENLGVGIYPQVAARLGNQFLIQQEKSAEDENLDVLSRERSEGSVMRIPYELQ